MFDLRSATLRPRTSPLLLAGGLLLAASPLVSQEAPPAAAPAATAPPAASPPAAAPAPAPAGVPSAVEAAKTGWEGAPSLPSANLPASLGPRPDSASAAAPAEAGGAAEPPAPAMPDPLVSPLEDPPVATDLVTEGAEPTPTESVVVNLINRLVERGVLTQGDAAELVSQARRDAAVANQNAAAAALVAADAAMASEEDIVVTHIPEPVKERLREEIREDLIAEMPPRQFVYEAGSGKEPGTKAVVGELEEIPDWVKRTRIFGDLRLRYDSTTFPPGNDNTGSFPDFNRINTGSPFDVSGFVFSPQLNVDEDRRRFRMRARAGIEADLGDGLMLGFRAATGNDHSPVSTNQTYGDNYGKYELWIDQAYVRWDTAIGSVPVWSSAGRFENPFYKTSDIIWDNDVNFDGIVVNASPEISESIRTHLTVGAFPIFNSGFHFPNNAPDKIESDDRYHYGSEAGVAFFSKRKIDGKFTVAYHDFDNVEGELSDPFIPITSSDAGSTDERRPPFAQKGNTYMALRNITPDPLNGFGTTNQYQYFGLASPFQVLAYNGRIDLHHWEPYQLSLLGEYAMNLGFDRDYIETIAVNNRGPAPAGGGPGPFEGGNVAWNAAVQFGKAVFEKSWDWNATVGYRFVESDAVLDAFADSDFGLGGTNMEGFTVGTSVAINPKASVQLRWMGANEIAGPPLKSDIIMFDFNAKF